MTILTDHSEFMKTYLMGNCICRINKQGIAKEEKSFENITCVHNSYLKTGNY